MRLCRLSNVRQLSQITLSICFTLALIVDLAIGQGPPGFVPEANLIPQQGMWSERPATRWQEAIVTGNGTLGAMIFGEPAQERIVLNHERLYEPLVDLPVPVPNIADALPEARRLHGEGKHKDGYLHLFNTARERGFPGIQWTDPYHPACAFLIDQPDSKSFKNYWRSTDFQTGVTAVHWQHNNQSFVRETFASRPDGIIVTRISTDGDAPIKATMRLVNQDARSKGNRTDKFGGGYNDPVIDAEEGWLTYRCKYKSSKRGYQVVARVIADTPTTNSPNASLSVESKVAVIFIDIQSLEDFSSSDVRLEQSKLRLSTLEADYDKLLNRHKEIHSKLFNRVNLDLQFDEDTRLLSTESLIQSQSQTVDSTLNAVLLQKMFDMGRYALISSSGEWPPNLMGIWNGDWRPKWSGDFTLDANVNLQIAAANIGNLPEAIHSYDRLVQGLVNDWKVNAKNLYGCRGVLSGCRTAGRGNLQTHFSEGFPGISWISGAQWLVLPMYEHWLTTGDQEYLQQGLLPLMKDIALFYEDFTSDSRDDNGKLMFVPSYSPENRPANANHSSVINATMDIACFKEVLTQLLGLGEEHVTAVERTRYQNLLEKLPKYQINSDGAIKEWTHPDLQDNYDHRHVSHLYPVWPGHEINPEDTPELFTAAKVAAAKRGRGNGSAHGLAHMALIGARLKDAELVEGNLRFMLGSGFVLPSLCTFHNAGRIYNSDMLNSLPAVVLESLVYSKPGEIELLPALPSSISVGEISGIACRNQTVVERMNWNTNDGSISFKLLSKVEQTISIRVRRGIAEFETVNDAKLIAKGSVLQVSLKANEAAAIELVLDR